MSTLIDVLLEVVAVACLIATTLIMVGGMVCVAKFIIRELKGDD